MLKPLPLWQTRRGPPCGHVSRSVCSGERVANDSQRGERRRHVAASAATHLSSFTTPVTHTCLRGYARVYVWVGVKVERSSVITLFGVTGVKEVRSPHAVIRSVCERLLSLLSPLVCLFVTTTCFTLLSSKCSFFHPCGNGQLADFFHASPLVSPSSRYARCGRPPVVCITVTTSPCCSSVATRS